MRPNLLRFGSFVLLSLILFGCSKETEQIDAYDYETERLTELLPLQVGKFITYQLDSTVFTNFGEHMEVHSYQEKNVVDAEITDNLGRPGYRVFRFTRDVDGLTGWTSAGSYYIIPTANTVEVIENNLRQVKLKLPLQLYYSWKGNSFLSLNPYGNLYNFSNDNTMTDWNYSYDSMDETIEMAGQSIEHVYTVNQVNESTNVPLSSADEYASINFAADKYAKGIGLVYQELIMWEYQPNTGGASPYYTGFGIKRTMIDHN